ncbi:hypothetical protein DSL92_06290 [Billgrantia gudaonensis]|uniref:Uncharacterized protein n=1 Tax=Billgrantia gudaonensis TaxID=376427 RepID=A0A3S0NDZ1_9GAMM|nr:hypothetical protein DSL92_06290 [Halomonas gudaonensis]
MDKASSNKRCRGEALDRKAAWFATLMTAGTHHPIMCLPTATAEGTERQQAFRYLDEAVDAT